MHAIWTTVLFADDKARLLEARAAIAAWLQSKRQLQLNPKHLTIEPTRTPVLLGYRISRAGLAPSRKLRRGHLSYGSGYVPLPPLERRR